jgi:hypothetical protein
LLFHVGVVTRVATRGDEGCGCPVAFCSRFLAGMAVPRRSIVRPLVDGRKDLPGMTEAFGRTAFPSPGSRPERRIL